MQSSLNTPLSTARFQPWVTADYANPDIKGDRSCPATRTSRRSRSAAT
jgi:hypothetical protein